MPVTATLLGSATGSGVDLTIPITVAQPAGTLVGVYAFANTGPGAFFDSQGFRSVPDDTQAGSWSFSTPHPFIGNTGDGTGGVGARLFGNVLSAIRTGGPDLTAGGGGFGPRAGCTTCGSMLTGTVQKAGGGAGDSVSVHWFLGNNQDPSHTAGLVVALDGVQDHIVTTDQSQFGNGDSYPSSGGPANTLNWNADLGPAGVPTPTADCAVITLAGAYGTSGWTPVNGSTVATVSDGTIFLGLSLNPFAASGAKVEPGGSFGGNSTYAAANYQTVRLV